MKNDMFFNTNTLEENTKLASELVEKGFDIKDPLLEAPVESFSELNKISEDDMLWKERYFILLDLINTFTKE